jgi:hypothetical protein
MPAAVTIIEREGVAGEDALQPRGPMSFCLAGATSLDAGPAAAYLVAVGSAVLR